MQCLLNSTHYKVRMPRHSSLLERLSHSPKASTPQHFKMLIFSKQSNFKLKQGVVSQVCTVFSPETWARALTASLDHPVKFCLNKQNTRNQNKLRQVI